MPNVEHVEILMSGVDEWNRWRDRQRGTTWPWDAPHPVLSGGDFRDRDLRKVNFSRVRLYRTDLRGANLEQADLTEADLQWADLRGANLLLADLSGANLEHANISEGAILTGAQLSEARLTSCNLEGANLIGADLTGADLHRADLRGALLSGADLSLTALVGTRLQGAHLDRCRVYGASVWSVEIDDKTEQQGLIITPKPPVLSGVQVRPLHEDLDKIISEHGMRRPELRQNDIPTVLEDATVTTDDLEVAQFIYLLLDRRKLRNVLTTLGEKAVLILGRFTERKALLDSMATRLRHLNYLPIIFDFERPTDRDLTETVKVLAGLSRFVIADITNPRSVPLELQATVPDYMVPFVTVLQRGQPKFGMFDVLPRKYNWALPLLEYNSPETLLAAFESKVVAPALEKLEEVRKQKALLPLRRSAED